MEHHSFYALFKLHWILLVAISIYVYMKKVYRSQLYDVTNNQLFYFFTAMTLILLLKGTPIDVTAKYYLFSAHILQLSFINFIAIPLVILSIPPGILRQLVWGHRTKFVLKILAHPWISLISFNGLLTIYLIPAVYNVAKQYVVIDVLFQLAILVTAIFMWWVIIQPLPEMKVLSHLLRAAYIFFASLALMPIGFFFVLVQNAHFPAYLLVERELFSVLSAIYDQQLAGGILKLTQMFTYSFALLFIMLQWGRREEAKEGTVDEANIKYVRGVVIHLKDGKNN